MSHFSSLSGLQLVLSKANKLDKSRLIRRFLKKRQMFEMNYKYNKEVLEWRKTRFEIHPLLHSRWSPSEMTGEQMSDQELFTLFEASRWAPSHYNVQPWRFIYAKKDSKYWQSFIDLLWPLNQKWCINASVLVMIISSKFYEHDGKQILYAIH